MRRLILAIVGLALSCQLIAVSLGVAEETDIDVPLTGISASLQPNLFTGTLTGSIPIDVPPGRNGMQPSLALTYASSGGNGWLGIGWKLEMGTIERQTRWGVLYNPTAQEELDGKVYTIRLNGVAKDLVQSPPPAPSNEYRAKIEGGFLHIKKLSADGTAGWEVTDTKGTKYKFGTGVATRIASGSMIFKWCLERVEDRDGNFMTITYTADQGQGYLSQINYTGNGAMTPTNQVKFYLEDRSDAPDMYASNFQIKTAKRLKTIEIKANGALVRAYKIIYSASVATSASLVSSVQQYGKDAIINVSGTITAGSVLPQTTLGYRTDVSGASFTNGSTWITGWCPSGTTGTADFNGDGKQDLWCQSGATQYVALSNGSGGFTDGGGWNIVNTGWCSAIMNPIDLDGNGTDDRWCWGSGWYFFNPDDPSSNIIHYLSWLNHPNTLLFTTNSIDGYQYQFWQTTEAERPGSADFNGDGKADAFFFDGSKLQYFFGTGTTLTYAGAVSGFCSSSSNGAFDFNGDGKADLWCHTGGTTTTLLSTGNGFVSGPNVTNWCASGAFGVGEFNGDGKSDFYCHPTDGTTQITLSTGSAFTTPTTWLSNWCASDQFGLGDFNGDGKRDLWCHPTDGTTQVALSTGSAFTAAGTWLSNWCPTGTFGVGDFTGDGKQDLYCHQSGQILVARSGAVQGPLDLLASLSNGLGGTTTISYLPSTSYSNTQLRFPLQTVAAIATNDGNGTVSTTSYLYSGGFFYVEEKDFRGFNYAQVTSPAGLNEAQSLSETWFHQGNDLTVDTNNPNVPTGYTKGLPYRTKVSKVSSPNVFLAETTTTYMADTDGIAPWFTPQTQVDKSVCDGGPCKTTRVTVTASDYDAYGNVKKESHHGDLAVTGDEKTIERAFVVNTTNYVVSAPIRETVYKGLSVATVDKLAETLFYYDGTGTGACTAVPSGSNTTVTKGHLTKTERWLSGGTNPISGMEYDPTTGVLLCTRDPLGNKTTLAYDPTKTFVLTMTDQLGHVVTSVHSGVNGVAIDPATGFYGQVKSMTDPNGKIVTNEYDALGRITKTTAPDGLVTTVTYPTLAQYGLIGTQKMTTSMSGASLPAALTSSTFFDGLGRTITKESSGPNSTTLVTKTEYTVKGRVSRTSLPYFKTGESVTGRWSTIGYDPLGRVIQVTHPDTLSGTALTSKSCYAPFVTVTLDPSGARKRETKDAYGRVVKIEEYNTTSSTCDTAVGTPYATTNYTYDLLGNLTKVVDTLGNHTTMRYDTLSRKLAMSDPDMSTNGTSTCGDLTTLTPNAVYPWYATPCWNYQYDAAGNLTRQTDAKNQHLWFRYDGLNRRTQKDYTTQKAAGSGDVRYLYDDTVTTFNRKGRLKQVIDAATNVTFEYDSRGRISKSTKVLDGTTYVTTSFYDGIGRLKEVTYPGATPKTVEYVYTGPVLERVRDKTGSGTTIYAIYSNYTSQGQAQTITYGNGVVTTSTFADPAHPACIPATSFKLCTLKTQKGTTPLYQDLTYTFTADGDVALITDPLNGNQGFGYDTLDRLTSATGRYGPGGATATLTYSYNQIGNMTSSGQPKLGGQPMGTYTYPASGPTSVRPHAVSIAGSYPISYDNNGNAISMTDSTGFYGYSASHDMENHLTSVTTTYGGVPTTATFVYDGDGGRVKKIVGTMTTRYISRLYECDTSGTTTSCSRFIWVGDTRIATVAVTSGAVHYWHGDHLGSSSVITNSTGAKVQAITYYPYGDLLTNQSFTMPAVDVPYKYTGKELDASSNLYFYESRYYQAVFGRFLSPDTIVPNPQDPQSFNRYSYVLNNPLIYTDPTGHEPCGFSKLTIFCEGGYGLDLDYYEPGVLVVPTTYVTAPPSRPSPPFANSWGNNFSPSLDGIFSAGNPMPEVTAAPVFVTAPKSSQFFNDLRAKAERDLENFLPGPAGMVSILRSRILANAIRGRASEANILEKLGLTKNTVSVSTREGKAIPDALTKSLSVEVKDSANVNLTRQLRIEIEAARVTGRESVLITGKKSCVSGPCSRAFDTIIRDPRLGPQ